MLNLYCANPECRWHSERKGGRFVSFGKDTFCEECARVRGTMGSCKNLWEFETTNLNGEKVQVKSLSHLRQLEREHGVVSVAANYESRHWNEPPQTRTDLQYRPVFGRE